MYCTSALRNLWTSLLYNMYRSDVDSNTLLFHYYSMDTLYMYVYILSEIKLYYYYYYIKVEVVPEKMSLFIPHVSHL